jgi:pre-mRNA-splicing factor SYF1
VIEVYKKALSTINPKKAHGRLQDFWIQFARFHEEEALKLDRNNPDLSEVRGVFENSLTVNFKHPDSLAECYIAYADMELRYNNLDRVRNILGRGTNSYRGSKRSVHTVNYFDDSLPVQNRVFKSMKLWSYFADFEEGCGTVASTKAVYERMMELKIVNAQVVINFAVFLEDNKYFEDAFKVYERGVELFNYPIAFDIWNIYLEKFMKRYVSFKADLKANYLKQFLCFFIPCQMFAIVRQFSLFPRAVQSWNVRVICLNMLWRSVPQNTQNQFISCLVNWKKNMGWSNELCKSMIVQPKLFQMKTVSR